MMDLIIFGLRYLSVTALPRFEVGAVYFFLSVEEAKSEVVIQDGLSMSALVKA